MVRYQMSWMWHKKTYQLPFLIATLILELLSLHIAAQQLKLGNHPTQKEKSAVLELESRNQGLLLTRVADTNNIAEPPDGMIIYFTDGANEEPYGPKAGIYERKNGSWHRPGIVLDTAVSKDQSAIKFTRENGVYVLHIPNATSGLRGIVGTGRQTFSGRKTFKDSITIEYLHSGSIIFTGIDKYGHHGLLLENNQSLFWDNTKENLGIGTNEPKANLDVNGNFKLGSKGTVIHGLIRDTLITLSDSTIAKGTGKLFSFSDTRITAGSSIIVSPEKQLPDGCMIAYSYSEDGVINIKIENVGSSDITIDNDIKFYVTVIQ